MLAQGSTMIPLRSIIVLWMWSRRRRREPAAAGSFLLKAFFSLLPSAW
ncbi:hypothetical protein [Paenibacillus polymyxa]|nr:hypothetical protein [Paenibacillus polymyxa]